MESIVYVSSTTALYDRSAQKLTEASPLGSSKNGYGRSKVDSERIANRLAKRGAPIAITYPATILGPDDPGMSEGSQGIALFFNHGMVITTTGIQIVDVRDVAEAHLRLVEGRRTGRYIVAGTYLSWSQLGDLLDRVTGKQLPRFPTPRIAARLLGRLMDTVTQYVRVESPFTLEAVTYATEWVVADNTRAERDLGLEFRPLEETLVETIRWLAEMGKIDPRWAEDLRVAG